ncbi:hypothetical protein FBU30_010394 [Linnemannia zychae]|nr:hypothetical protein FBU30_010394 [Linnemannia zychae]
MDMSAIQNFEPRKYAMPEHQAQQPMQQPMQQQITGFKQPIQMQPPRVLEYSPYFGPEGQTFTVTLQSNSDKALRIGFGTLVVDTKQYAANGYVTLSCIVPNFAITKWFVNKVPLYVLQMENDMVMESWPFGDYNYCDEIPSATPAQTAVSKRSDKMMYEQGLSQKKHPLVTDLDLSHAQLNQQHQQQASPLATPSPLNGNDYNNLSVSSAYDNSSLYSPTSPYGPRTPISPYGRTGYYPTSKSKFLALQKPQVYSKPLYLRQSTDMYKTLSPLPGQMIAPQMPSYSQADLVSSTYAMSPTANSNAGYIHSQNNSQPTTPGAYMPQSHPNASNIASVGNYNPYSSLLNKANLKFTGNMDDMAINWTGEEWESHRRLVQFWRRQDGNDIHCNFAPVAPADRQPNSIVVSCIYWAEKNDCFLTSVDCIYLLESLIAVRFTVEEKNRIRRNLEGFRPITVSKCKPESAEFFKLIMSFPNPKPRNIEKDVKVFPWKVLPYALKKIISKYTASYSSTASIQADAFHNANFPHGSTLPLTPQQQSIIESSLIV